VGLQDKRYGEVVGAFLGLTEGGEQQRPGDEVLRRWVRERLGHHKAPAHIFWLGQGGVPTEVPLTGSGKVKKFEMARLGDELLRSAAAAAKL
jgi:long-chain acyl-CoA synthetase